MKQVTIERDNYRLTSESEMRVAEVRAAGKKAGLDLGQDYCDDAPPTVWPGATKEERRIASREWRDAHENRVEWTLVERGSPKVVKRGTLEECAKTIAGVQAAIDAAIKAAGGS